MEQRPKLLYVICLEIKTSSAQSKKNTKKLRNVSGNHKCICGRLRE